MLDNAAYVIQRGVRQSRIAVASKGIVTPLGDGLVHVHARAVVSHQWLGHKGCRFAVGMGDVEYAVLKDLHLIRLGDQGVELDANFTLTCGAHLMVVNLDVETHLLHRGTHSGTDVMQ